MGRGRAKAKQQKVARELKYGGPDTDLSRLAAELSSEREHHAPAVWADEESEEDKYADWIDTEADTAEVDDESETVEIDGEDRR